MNIKETNLKFGNLSVRPKTSRIILHHADATTCDAKTIHQWHINNGWSGIGYHFVVRKNGTIERGRPENTVGAHAEGSNTDSIGICFEGNFQTETMSTAQKDAGKELVAYLKQKYSISKVQKHSDVCATTCPGKNFPFSEIANASVNTVKNGLSDTKDPDGSWYYYKNGQIAKNITTVAQNKNGWFFVKNGKVDFSYTGIAKNDKGWWRIEKGKVNKSYNGLGSNSNGTWLVENGRVDFSFSGKKTINGVEYTFKEGRCMNNYRGWKKLGGKYYYFDRNTGAQMKNCTVDGIRLNSDGSAVSSAYNNEKIRTMIKARSIMESITNKSDSKETKLRKCFDWVMKHPYKRYRTLKVARQKAGWEMLFANDHFERGQGCCVSDACAFAFLAHECGYNTVYVCDDTGHAWAEINGRAFDPLFAEAKSFSKNYNAPYGVYILHPVNKKKI